MVLNLRKILKKDDEELIEEVKKNFYEILFPEKSLFEVDQDIIISSRIELLERELSTMQTKYDNLVLKLEEKNDFFILKSKEISQSYQWDCHNLTEAIIFFTVLSILIIIMLCKNYICRKIK